jgi:DNA-binding NtrC family response regulator
MNTAKTTNWAVLEALQPVEELNSSRMAEKIARVKVLVVDDEPLIRWAVAETLGDLGYQVVQAADGRGAMAAISESAPFEIVLLDVRLPDSDDLTLLNRLRSLVPAARIILMTAHGTQEMTERAMDLGAFTVVSKPFELTELAALVSRARNARPS